MEQEQNTQTENHRKFPLKRVLLVCIPIVTIVLAVIINTGVQTGFFTRMSREFQNLFFGRIHIETGTYTGETDWGDFFGDGSFQFESGEVYSGSWEDNQFTGYGSLSYPDIGTYEGNFSGFKKEGTGTFTWASGDVYTGQWEDDAMEGKGIYTFATGGELEGAFRENQFWSGTYTVSNTSGSYKVDYLGGEMCSAEIHFSDGTTYSGDFSDGKLNGTGEMYYANGDTYAGAYRDGVRSGYGTYVWVTGDQYKGHWTDDVIDGKGVYTFASGMTLDGSFSKGEFVSGAYSMWNDDGTFEFDLEDGIPVSVQMELTNGLQYDGGLSQNTLDGEGKIVYPSGETYEGEFSEGKRDGDGTYTWLDGSSYTGDWSDDQVNGTGTYTYPKGSEGLKLRGSFVNGQPDGQCTYYLASGLSYVTTWEDGTCIKLTE